MATINFKKDSDDVSAPLQVWDDYMDRLELLHTLMGGTLAIRDSGEKFLPKEEDESNENYSSRLGRNNLFNGFKRTILYLCGQVFSKPLHLQNDNEVDSKIKDLLYDIDLQGNNFHVFCKKWFETLLVDGVCGILVDFPSVEENTTGKVLTQAQEKSRGLRPYWILLPMSNVIGWRTEIREGKVVFTQLRIRETISVPDGKYGEKKVNHVRVLFPGRYELWKEVESSSTTKGKWEMIESKPTSIPFIPFTFCSIGSMISTLTCIPPLEDLAYLNLEHWQSNSDQNNILHFARVPILFGKGIVSEGEKVVVGPNRLIHARDTNADLRYVEHGGAAIDSGRQNLLDLENRMALYGLQLLMPKTGDVTATEKALASAENDSTLKTWALMFQDAIDQALVITGSWLKILPNKCGSAKINDEFRLLQSADADVLLRAWQGGMLPREIVVEEFKIRGLITIDWDKDELEDMLENELRIISGGGFSRGGTNITGGIKTSASKFLKAPGTPGAMA